MKICIIGGGLTGLVAAHSLAGDHGIELFEQRSSLGGCVASYEIGGSAVEQYYHHCFSSDDAFLSLLDTLNLTGRLEWRNATTGYYAGGILYPLSTPLQILKYPYLSLADKAKLALLTLQVKGISTKDLDTVTAEQFVRTRLGDGIYTSFFEPLLNSKFGGNKKTVSAAWLVSRIAIRSNRGIAGENLGYIAGGFRQLINALEASILKNGGKIHNQSPVTTIRRANGAFEVNGMRYDTIISTIPPPELERIGGPSLPPVQYQGAACMTLGLERDVTRGIYWLNMKDPAPYGAVVAHTNFIPPERYGCHIVYLASYFSGRLPLNVDRHMITDFCSRFHVPRNEILWSKMAVEPFAGPVYTLGYRSLIPAYEQGGLFVAGMFSLPNYPERSMDGAVRAGSEVADLVRRTVPRG